jgi:aspartyl-tRNA(Asn)/glutamyl-tRNA(Gln) amidotransferase subunit A
LGGKGQEKQSVIMKLNQLTIKQASELLAKGEITSVELTKACLARIREVDDKIKACLTVCEEEALEEAKKADERRENVGAIHELPLLGIPYLCKDNIMTRGVRTTAGSKILENYTAPFDATVVRKLRSAGAVLLGKTNMDEFGHGASTENSGFFPTHNPWDLERVSGGSSGGSAAGVAADMCIFALGTDTGGSTRQPASFCGVVGLKPTYGRASRYGLIAMTSSTDVPGIITKTVEDAGLVLSVIAGKDKNDSTTVDNQELSSGYPELSSLSLAGLKIGLPKEYFVDGVEDGVMKAINQAIEKLKELGAEFTEVSLPHTKYAIPVYYIITPSEISSNLARFDGIKYGFSDKEAKNLFEVYTKSRGKGFGPEVKRRIMLGTYALSAGYYDAYYLRAQKVRTKIREEMDEALKEVDCLLTPASPHTAFKIGEQSDDPLKMYLEDIFMAAVSLSGLPAVSIPCGFDRTPPFTKGETPPSPPLAKGGNKGGCLPVGMQLIGGRFDEAMLFRVGSSYEKAAERGKAKIKI